MAKNKPKQSSNKQTNKQVPQTIFFSVGKWVDLPVLKSTFQNFYSKLNKEDNIIIINNNDTNLKTSDFLEKIDESENLKIFNSFPDTALLKQIVNKKLTFINTEYLYKEITTEEITRATKNEESDIRYLNYVGAQENIISSPIVILQNQLFFEYLENYQKWADFNTALYFLINKNFWTIEYFSLQKKSNIKVNRLRINPNYIKRIRLWYIWLISQPTKDIINNRLSFKDNSSIYRICFLALALISLIFIALSSFKAGISGDEPVNYKHAEYVYNYYTEGDSAALNTPRTKLQYYGQSFDNLTYIFNKTFKIKNYYESRHFFNALTGWLTMLVTAGLVIYLAGWRAGLLAFLFILFSPRFLGHSWNNPKDIPFAFTYILSIFFQIKLINELPRLKASTLIFLALSIAFSISVRIGGLLLIAYQFLFLGAYIVIYRPFKNSKAPANKTIYTGLSIGAACVIGYFLGLLLWPYALENPIKNPMESLKIMTNFTAALRQTFMGDIIWSDNAPWNYVPVYILITTPIVIILGLITFLFIIWKNYNLKRKILMGFVAFTFFFPIFYIIYKSSNVYGGWRHVLFTYPSLVAISAIGLNSLVSAFKIKWQPYLLLLILLSLGGAILHTFKNHPYQYIYFNQLAGGVKGAFGNYEMDYYYHSLKEGAGWLEENELNSDTTSNVIVATNHGELVSYYLRNNEKAKVTYVRYYNRGNSNWDYAIIANSYINPNQQKKGYWPPANTIHTIDVDGVPICAILKRNNKSDLKGYQELKKKDYYRAVADLQLAIQNEKTNEVAYINLASAYMYVRRFDLARQTINQLLEIYPKYDKALNIYGLTYFNERNYEEAYKIFTSVTEINPKFVNAYHNLGLVFMRMNKKSDAIKYFQQAIKINRRYKPSYLAIGRILRESGKEAEAQKYFDAANKL